MVRGVIIGGRGGYSLRKNNLVVATGTKTAKAKAAASFAAEERAGVNPTALGGGTTHEAMMSEFKTWAGTLSETQTQALNAYRDGQYSEMNRQARGTSEKDQWTQKYIKDMDSSLNHTLTRNIRLYRGTNIPDPASFKAATTVGSVFKDNGYFSASVSQTTAQKFIKAGKANPVKFTVIFPKGQKGGYMDAKFTEWENEFVPKRGTNYRVVKELKSLTRGGKKIKHMLIEAI